MSTHPLTSIQDAVIRHIVAIFMIVGYLSGQVSGQTEGRITPRTGKVPRIADGKPNLQASGPMAPSHRSDGRHSLTARDL